MERINDYKSFSRQHAKNNAVRLSEEKSALQKEYQEYFMSMLHKYDIASVSELDDEGKAKFFDELSTGYKPGEGTNDTGKEIVKDAEKDGADIDVK